MSSESFGYEEKRTKKRYESLAYFYDLDDLMCLGLKQKYRKKLLKKTLEKNPETVLDVATGTGRMAKLDAKKAKNVIGLDITKNMIKIARFRNRKNNNTYFTQANAAKLPFQDESFQAITCSCGLDTVDKPKKVFRELERVLEPKGRLGLLYFSKEDGLLNYLDFFIKKFYNLVWDTQNVDLMKEIKNSSLKTIADVSPPFATGIVLEKQRK